MATDSNSQGHRYPASGIQGQDCTGIRQFHYSQLSMDLIEVLAKIARTAFAEYTKDDINMRDVTISSQQFREDLSSGDETVFIYFHAGQPVGYIRGRLLTERDIKYIHDNGLATLPEFRNQGIGYKLVQGFEEWGLQLGAEYALVDTCNRAPKPKRFHHRCGYKDWYYIHWSGKKYISIVMRKDYGTPYSSRKRLFSKYFSWVFVHLIYDSMGQERVWYRLKAKWLGKNIMRTWGNRNA